MVMEIKPTKKININNMYQIYGIKQQPNIIKNTNDKQVNSDTNGEHQKLVHKY